MVFRVTLQGGRCDWSIVEGGTDFGQQIGVSTKGTDPVKVNFTPTTAGPVEVLVSVECADPTDSVSDAYLVSFDVPAAATPPTPPTASTAATGSSAATSPAATATSTATATSPWPWIGCGGMMLALALFALAALLCSGLFGAGLFSSIWIFGHGNSPPPVIETVDPAPPVITPEPAPVEDPKPKTVTRTIQGYRINGRACYSHDDAEYLRQALNSPTLPPHTFDGPFVCFDDEIAKDMLAQLGYYYVP